MNTTAPPEPPQTNNEMLLPAQAVELSRLALPIELPLAPLAEAIEGKLPAVLVNVAEERALLGGLARVEVKGAVQRGRLSLRGDGGVLELRLPISAALQLRPVLGALGTSKTVQVGAVVVLRHRPELNENWQLSGPMQSRIEWQRLDAELWNGARLDLRELLAPSVERSLPSIESIAQKELDRGLALPLQAEALWRRVAKPFDLPELRGQAAQLQFVPHALSASPVDISNETLRTRLYAEGQLQATLGKFDVQEGFSLPALGHTGDEDEATRLRLALRLPFDESAELMRGELQRALDRRSGSSRFVVEELTLRPSREQIGRLEMELTLSARVLGKNVPISGRLSGIPALSGQTLFLDDPDLELGGRVGRGLGPIVKRLEPIIERNARIDLGPKMHEWAERIRAELPLEPRQGLRLDGELRRLQLSGVRLLPEALEVQAAADGGLRLQLDAAGLLR